MASHFRMEQQPQHSGGGVGVAELVDQPSVGERPVEVELRGGPAAGVEDVGEDCGAAGATGDRTCGSTVAGSPTWWRVWIDSTRSNRPSASGVTSSTLRRW